jgi:hypothetical protein
VVGGKGLEGVAKRAGPKPGLNFSCVSQTVWPDEQLSTDPRPIQTSHTPPKKSEPPLDLGGGVVVST